MTNIKPFLKWAGGKFKLIDIIKSHLPATCNHYYEPFVGAGSMSFNVDYTNITINDINSDLTNCYINLKNYKEKFITDCQELFVKENNTVEAFKRLKEEFNSTADLYRKSLLFIYLNKHCFNGLCRYNSKGLFNTPIGRYTTVTCPADAMFNIAKKLETFNILNTSFEDVMGLAKSGDTVYCDPPYVPISASSSFASYSTGGFNLDHHRNLANCAYNASQRGVFVLISNSACQIVEEVYNKGEFIPIQVNRFISSKSESRGKVGEYLIKFSPF